MFGGNDPDPFSQMFGHMHRQMSEMDRVVNSMMMDPFAGMYGNAGQMSIEGHAPQRQVSERASLMNPFGFGGMGFGGMGFGGMGLFGAMNQMHHHAMNDPNAHVYTQSTMVTFGEDGKPRVVEKSMRKAGDVKETRSHLQEGDREEMSIGHSIGDRTHVIEKKRDKDGVRKQQRFVNLDEANAEDFDREFHSRARVNMYGGSNGRNGNRYAVSNGENTTSRYGRRQEEPRSGAPIITLPEEEETTFRRPSPAQRIGGPVIREISDEEAESSIPKRRRFPYGRHTAE